MVQGVSRSKVKNRRFSPHGGGLDYGLRATGKYSTRPINALTGQVTQRSRPLFAAFRKRGFLKILSAEAPAFASLCVSAPVTGVLSLDSAQLWVDCRSS